MNKDAMNLISCPSLNFDARAGGQSPSMIIIHYTGTLTADEARHRFCDANPTDAIGRISPHYMIGADAEIYKFVDEDKRAWHAGRASWGTVTDINSASIGIEIWNTGHEFHFEDFMSAQIDALINLIQDIRSRWSIADKNILGHSDVAPGRKLDPGEKFPWGQLASAGIGLMPELQQSISDSATPMNEDEFYNGLKSFGYSYTDDRDILLTEFRRHFLPHLLGRGRVSQTDIKMLSCLISS